MKMIRTRLFIPFLVMMIIITTIGLTLIAVTLSNNYELLSNEELINISNAAYIQGALSISDTGNIPYVDNNTIKVTTIEEQCNYLNKIQEVKS